MSLRTVTVRRNLSPCASAIASAGLALLACAGQEVQRAAPEETAPASAETRAVSESLEEGPRCALPAPGYGVDCDGCLAARCCDPIEACKSDSLCAEQLGCVVRCQTADDPGRCSMDCIGDTPAANYLAYEDCSFSECLMACWN